MRILFWTGYAKAKWNKGTWENNGIGGSEYCVIKLADYLDTEGYDVTITGDVYDGNWYGVEYKHHTNLKQGDHYDVVIAINYIHYHKHLEELNITFDKNIFWLHNEEPFRWYKGGVIEDIKSELDKIDVIVGVSRFHANIIKDKLKALNYTHPKNDTYIRFIDNAIDLNDYTNLNKVDKIKNRIIWTSSPDRGLELILNNWDDWKQQVPDLSLEICCPPYALDWFKRDITELKDVNWRGSLDPKALKHEIMKAEWWVYQSDYTETYCISALEMMMGNVKIITNSPGNLEYLVTNARGTIVRDNLSVIDIIKNNKVFSSKTVKAREWAEKQNWYERIDDWKRLINGTM